VIPLAEHIAPVWLVVCCAWGWRLPMGTRRAVGGGDGIVFCGVLRVYCFGIFFLGASDLDRR